MFRTIRAWVGFILVATILTGTAIGINLLITRYTRIVVANVNLSPGMPLRDGHVGLRMVPVATIPSGALESVTEIRSMYVRENIIKGSAITSAQITTAMPSPVRTVPKWGYSLLEHLVPRNDAEELFVGDRVDVTVFRFRGDRATAMQAIMRGEKVETEPLTARKGWVVHHIDYGDTLSKGAGYVRVTIEARNEELGKVFGYPEGDPRHSSNPSLPVIGASRMTRSNSKGE